MATMPTIPRPVNPVFASGEQATERLRDRFGRSITDLRVAVTDRCNYRCVYCRTGESSTYTELPIADYASITRLLAGMGIEKVRLTGGEPLLRAGLLDLIRELRTIRTDDKWSPACGNGIWP